MVFTLLHRKVIKSLAKRGLLGTVLFAARAALLAAKALTPSRRRARRAVAAIDRDFDAHYGVDTGGMISLEALSIICGDPHDGGRYQPIGPGAFRDMMRHVGDVTGFTFIDFGSGKGRALLLASEYPFRKIVGVEFASELVAVSRQNLTAYRNPAQLCKDIGVVAGDAAEFALPPGPLLLFFFNPFGPKVMLRVIENVRRSLESDPRPVVVLYSTPLQDALWASIPCLVRQPSPDSYSVYRSRSPT
jgi:hypothetical protein